MALLLIIVVLILVAEHNYRHWTTITGTTLPHPKRLILNYVTGTLAWFGPFSLWLLSNGLWRETYTGWAFVSVAGLTVVLMYWHDAAIAKRQKMEDAAERLEYAEAKRRENAEAPRP